MKRNMDHENLDNADTNKPLTTSSSTDCMKKLAEATSKLKVRNNMQTSEFKTVLQTGHSGDSNVATNQGAAGVKPSIKYEPARRHVDIDENYDDDDDEDEEMADGDEVDKNEIANPGRKNAEMEKVQFKDEGDEMDID